MGKGTEPGFPYGGVVETTLGGVTITKFDGPMDANGNSPHHTASGRTEKEAEGKVLGKGASK